MFFFKTSCFTRTNEGIDNRILRKPGSNDCSVATLQRPTWPSSPVCSCTLRGFHDLPPKFSNPKFFLQVTVSRLARPNVVYPPLMLPFLAHLHSPPAICKRFIPAGRRRSRYTLSYLQGKNLRKNLCSLCRPRRQRHWRSAPMPLPAPQHTCTAQVALRGSLPWPWRATVDRRGDIDERARESRERRKKSEEKSKKKKRKN